MDEKLIKKTEEKIKEILEEDINPNNLEYLYKLTKIKHIAKEEQDMYGNYGNYGNYGGRRAGYDSYGRGNYGEYGNYGENYGRRGYDMKYRGNDYMDRMGAEYGRYMESRNRYGASEETDKAYHYMVKSLEDFIKFLYEDAENPQQKQMISETLQRSMM